jgi:hypothetical protein
MKKTVFIGIYSSEGFELCVEGIAGKMKDANGNAICAKITRIE